jgi:hypothetical protein
MAPTRRVEASVKAHDHLILLLGPGCGAAARLMFPHPFGASSAWCERHSSTEVLDVTGLKENQVFGEIGDTIGNSL